MIGQTVGHYRVLAKLGQGGMGEVYLAEDRLLDRRVALKFLSEQLRQDEVARRRFVREAKSAAALDHPFVCKIYEAGQANGIEYIAMEFVSGIPLKDKIIEGPLGIDVFLRLACEVTEALEEAHARMIIHRDLKPANIMLTAGGHVKVMDFGLAKRLALEEDLSAAEATLLTREGSTMGTLAYMAPEQIAGTEAHIRTDIFSLGVVFYEALTGVHPFRRRTAVETVRALLSEEAAPLKERLPGPPERLEGASAGLDKIVLRCLQKDPCSRYQSVSELSDDLRRLAGEVLGYAVMSGERVQTSRKASARNLGQRRLRLSGWVLMLVAVIVSSIVGLVVKDGWWEGFSSEPSQPSITSLAVLPLANLSLRPEQGLVVEAFHEALITELSRINALRVISRTSTVGYLNSSKSLPEIAEELNVDAIVEGSVFQAGSRLRVTVQLIQASPERHLWADNFDRELTDVLYLTRDVAQAVAGQIRVTLSPGEQAQLGTVRPVNPEAYEFYAVGRHQWNQRTLDGYKRAIESFSKALERDPEYALVHAALADTYMLLGEQGGLPQDKARSLAAASIGKAVELDENSAEAYSSLAHLKFFYEWNWAEAEQAYRRAIQLNPGYAAAHQMYGRSLGFLGRFEEALVELHRARQLDPLSVTLNDYLGQLYLFSRQYDRALEQFQWTLELDPNHPLTLHNLGELYLSQGNYTEAVGKLQRSVEMSREPSTHYVAFLGCAYAKANRQEDAIEILDSLLERSEQDLVSTFDLAALQAALGETESAIILLERGYVQRDIWLAELKAWPWFDSLLPDPRFQTILLDMNFPR